LGHIDTMRPALTGINQPPPLRDRFGHRRVQDNCNDVLRVLACERRRESHVRLDEAHERPGLQFQISSIPQEIKFALTHITMPQTSLYANQWADSAWEEKNGKAKYRNPWKPPASRRLTRELRIRIT
jgi:hypothetical protein